MRTHIKKYNLIASFLLAAFLLSFLPARAAVSSPYISASYPLTEGLSYTSSVNYDSSWVRTEDYVLEYTPGTSIRPIVFPGDTIYGGYTVSEAIAYEESRGYNVVAAVNSDFFNMSSKTPIGLVVEDGIVKSGYGWQNVLYFSEDGSAHVVNKPWITFSITNTTEGDRYGKEVSTINYNKIRSSSGLWLYSQYFSTVSTRTSARGWMIRFKILSGEMRLGTTLDLEVEDIYEDTTSQPIGDGTLILTAQEAADLGYVLEDFAVGDTCSLAIKCYDEGLIAAPYACGCGNILVENGQITDSSGWDSSISTIKAPRTALGIREDGTLVTYVEDGRSSYSTGSTLRTLAEKMQSLGCVTVVNLDGGGSSALAVRLPGTDRATVQNAPSDGQERSCATYILFVSEEEPTGAPSSLSIKENGSVLLSGSSLSLTPTACDRALKKAEVPADTGVTASLGQVQGLSYTCGKNDSGHVTLSLSSSSTGAKGTADLWVTDSLSTFSLKDASTGKAISQASLLPGKTLSLTYTGTYLKEPVTIDSSCVTWTCDEAIGTVTQDGVFTASDSYGATGTVTASCGGKTASVAVTVLPHFTDMEGNWALTYVGRLYEKGYVAGTSSTTYSPDASLTRASLMVLVYSIAGKPDVSYSPVFSDVPEGQWFTSAVIWAKDQGITAGYPDGTFRPNDPVTNEQAWTFLKSALNMLGYSGDVSYDESVLEAYADGASIAEYARAGASLFARMGGVTVDESGLLCPKDPISRAAMAKLLCYGIWGE